jgi:hypothetical protein
MNIRFLPFLFTGTLLKSGKGPYSLDSESITLKPEFFRSKCVNKAVEVCLVSGSTEYVCFFMQ